MSTFTWRDAFIAMVNRTSSKRLTVTDEELARARETNNGMIIDNGKWSVLAGEFGISETINADMANGFDSEAEKVFSDSQMFGVGFSMNGKHVPYSEAVRSSDEIEPLLTEIANQNMEGTP